MVWYPHVTVATIVELDNRFLLVEERSNGNSLVYNQPAGHLEKDESLTEAAVRETLEETGWTVEIEGIVGLGLYTSPHNQTTYHRTTFYAKPISHDPSLELDEGIVQALWMNLDEMQAASEKMRSHLVIQAVQQYQQGHRYPLSMIYE